MEDIGFQFGSIRLEQTPTAYYPGQTLNGSVVFELREPLNFSALLIQFHGRANVLWSYFEIETVHGTKREREIKYQGQEEYFNHTETLAGGYGTTQLPRSQHAFPFQYKIPFNCPSSFYGQKGSISYSITATMVYPDSRRESLTKIFTVVSPLDLNTGNPSIKEPIDLELEELNPCSWCCGSDSVTVRLRLPVTGYCPGQNIPVEVEVQNQSSVEIAKMIFEITTSEMYRSQQPPSEYVVPGKTLISVEKGAVLAGCKKNFVCEVAVPEIIVPYLEHCSIIDVGYFFKATVVLSGCNDDLYDESEICLGLVPLRETVTADYRHPMADSLPPGPIPINDQPTAPNQPLSQSVQNNLNGPPPYPGSNTPYPSDNKNPNSDIGFRTPQSAGNPAYPGTGNPPYPGAGNTPYPGAGNSPYPGAGNTAYPGAGNPSYPGAGNPAYPGVGNTAYPAAGNSAYPYPASSLMPGAAPPPYPSGNSPQGSPYPGNMGNNAGLPPKPGYAPSAPPPTA